MMPNTPNRAGLGMRPPAMSMGQGPPIGSLPPQGFVPPPMGMAVPPVGGPRVATLFIGSISAGITDNFLNELLATCGPTNALKRMITPAGKPQGFGFVEYLNPESAVRAVKLLNGVELPAFEDGCVNKKLLVKPDEKTRMLLDVYSANVSSDDSDTTAQEQIKELLARIQSQSVEATNSGLLDRDKYIIPPHLHDLQETDLPETQRGLITSEIAMFREKSAKRERERMRDVLKTAEAYSAKQGGPPTQPKGRDWGKTSGTGATPPDAPRGFGKGPQSYDKPVSFVKGGTTPSCRTPGAGSEGKTDLELEEERREARKEEELRSFKDRERRYEPRERARISSIEKTIARERAQRDAEERDREEMRHRLDIWDDDESDEMFYVDRLRWRSLRTRRLATEEQTDAKSRRFEEQEAENLRRESEDFLAKQMEDMQALAEEQRKAGMLLDDGVPVKLNVAMTTKPATEDDKMDVDELKGRPVFGADEEEEEETTRRRRKANLQKLEVSVSESVDVEKARERLTKMRENVPKDQEALWKWKVRWDAMSESMVDRKFEPLVKRLMTRYLGEMEEDDLILFVMEHLKDHKSPNKLVEGLEPVLEEEAIEFTISVWRQVVFESMAYGDGLLTGSMMVDD